MAGGRESSNMLVLAIGMLVILCASFFAGAYAESFRSNNGAVALAEQMADDLRSEDREEAIGFLNDTLTRYISVSPSDLKPGEEVWGIRINDYRKLYKEASVYEILYIAAMLDGAISDFHDKFGIIERGSESWRYEVRRLWVRVDNISSLSGYNIVHNPDTLGD